MMKQALLGFWHRSPLYFWLLFIVAILYVPFIETSMIRTTGDERVYISQALEMRNAGNWFFQILGGEPSYYKGPLHYILLRIGLLIFGDHSMWAILYMNILFLLLGTLSLYALLTKFYGRHWGCFGGMLLLFCGGVHAHTFSSQMEITLVGLFAFFMWLFDRLESRGYKFIDQLLLWTLIGVCGWVKSPLYSALLGVSVALFWVIKRELVLRLSSLSTLASICWGVFVGVLAYLPAIMHDWQSFYETYLQREHFLKGSTSYPFYYSIIHFFANLTLPWGIYLIVFCFFSLFKLLYNQRLLLTAKSLFKNQMFLYVFSLSLPSVVFFSFHSYRMANYLIPLTSVGVVGCVMFWKNRVNKNIVYVMQCVTITVCALIPLGITFLYFWFLPTSSWISTNFIISLWVLFLMSFVLHYFFIHNVRKPWLWSLSLCPLFFAINLILCQVATKEYRDVFSFVKDNKISQMSYYNLNKNIWNEWGLLNFIIKEKFTPIDKLSQFNESIKYRRTVICPDQETLLEAKKYIKNHGLENTYEIKEWSRWKTHGKNKNGKPMWIDAILTHNLNLLQRKSYFIRFI